MDVIEINRYLNDLLDERLRKGITGDDVQIQDEFPAFYNKVMNLIYRLGTETYLNGHSELMDEFKERAFKLIGL